MEHYLITKYNLGIWQRGSAEIWMNHRKKLFEDWTYPSVMAQTSKNFKWIVMIDENTPEKWYKDYDFTPLLMNFSSYNPCVKYLKKNCKSDWIITTRLDNDDWIAPTFIEEIQKCFFKYKTSKNKFLIDTWGVKFYTPRARDSRRRGKTVEIPHFPGSHFISLCERTDDIRMVRFMEHRQLPGKFPCKMITENLYKEIIHDKNIANG